MRQCSSLLWSTVSWGFWPGAYLCETLRFRLNLNYRGFFLLLLFLFLLVNSKARKISLFTFTIIFFLKWCNKTPKCHFVQGFFIKFFSSNQKCTIIHIRLQASTILMKDKKVWHLNQVSSTQGEHYPKVVCAVYFFLIFNAVGETIPNSAFNNIL